MLGLLAEAGGGLVALAGLIFAIVAVSHVSKLGPDGLLGKGALGLMLNGGFLLIIATNLIAGRERATGHSRTEPIPAQAQQGRPSSPVDAP